MTPQAAPRPAAHPRKLRAVIFIAIALLLAYALAGFLLAPWYAKRELPRFAEEQLHQRARVGDVVFNPFTLRLHATDFALEEMDGRAVLGFGTADVALEWSSLFRRAWVLAELRVVNPSVRVGISKDGKVNLAALAASGGTGPTTSETARFNVRHIAIENGSIDFEDLRSGYKGGLRRLSFKLSPLTTLDPVKGPYALLAETPNGGKLGWNGELSLQPLTASGTLVLENTSLPEFTAYLDEFSTARIVSGRADLELPYRFAFTEGKPGLTLEGGKLALRELALAPRGSDAPFVKFAKLTIEGMTLDTLTHRASAQALRVADLALAARRDAKGELDLERMFAGNASGTRPAAVVTSPAAAKPAPWHAEIAAVELAGVSSSYVDESSKKPLNLRQRGLSAKLKLELDSGDGDVRARISAGEMTIAEIQAGAALPQPPVVAFENLALSGLRFDTGANALEADALRAGKFSVDAAMDGDRLSLLDFLPPPEPDSEKPMALSVKSVEFANGTVTFADRGQGIAVALERLAGKLGNVSLDTAKPLSFELAAGMRGGGKISARGRAVPKAGTVAARVEATGVPLTPLQPFLERYASAKFAAGEVSAAGQLRAGGTNPKLSFTGTASATGVAIDDTAGTRLVSWKSLATDTLRLSLAPDRVEIDELRWTAPVGRFAIATDGTTNLSRAFARKDGTTQASSPPNVVPPSASPVAPAAPAAAATLPEQPASADADAFAMLIRRVRIDAGELDFSDASLSPAFGTKMHSLTGTVNGISSDRTARAQFALDGRVDEFGSARLTGTLNPFAWRDNTNIGMQFRNIDLAGASTYSMKFAGYRIASGRLALDLNYRVRDAKLEGDNKIILEKFTLGEKVESAGALDLPIGLAIALLKDADGRIDLAVPIAGSIDDPQFGIGTLVGQALRKIISNIVTAPFRALAHLFGGSAESSGAIAFDPGSSRLLPPAREQIGHAVEVLAKRPELKLGIPARYDSVADTAALRRDALAREVAKRAGFKVAEDEAPGPVSVEDRPTRAALRALFAERFPAAEFAKLKAEAEAEAKAKEGAAPAADGKAQSISVLDRARNFATGEPQVADPREFYRALLRQLRDAQPLPENALAELAQRRGAAIAAALQAAGVDPARVSRSVAEPVARAEAKEVTVELSLSAK
jgi:uncharacterized protein involved in outer membrane biogenesis